MNQNPAQCPDKLRNIKSLKDFISPNLTTPGVLTKLRKEGLRGTPLLRGVMVHYAATFGVVMPTSEKPIVVYTHNDMATRGGIDLLKGSIKNRG